MGISSASTTGPPRLRERVGQLWRDGLDKGVSLDVVDLEDLRLAGEFDPGLHQGSAGGARCVLRTAPGSPRSSTLGVLPALPVSGGPMSGVMPAATRLARDVRWSETSGGRDVVPVVTLLRLALALMVIGALGLSAVSPAGAATYTTSVSPDPFAYLDTESLTYRLHITSGSQPERLRVYARAPSFIAGPAPWHSPLRLDQIVLEGPGTVLNRGGSFVIGDRFCNPVLPDMHGSNQANGSSIEVDLPANSTSALALPAHPSSSTEYAPWPGMDLAVEFQVEQSAGGGQQVIRSPSPSTRRHGMQISLSTDPPGDPGGCSTSFRQVESGEDILVSGRADPAVAGQLMTIRAVRSKPDGGPFGTRIPEGAPIELARVSIADDGSFAYRWRPTPAGEYTVGALYQSQSPELTNDFSNPANLRVGPPPTSAPPPAETPSSTITASPVPRPDLLRPKARGRRRGSLIISTARGAVLVAGGQDCPDRVKLEAWSRKQRIGVQHAALNRTCRWSSRYVIPIRRLPSLARRRLAHGRPITLTVTARLEGNVLSAVRSPSRRYRIRP